MSADRAAESAAFRFPPSSTPPPALAEADDDPDTDGDARYLPPHPCGKPGIVWHPHVE